MKQRIIINVFWSFGEQLLRKGSSVLITLVLAWFLTPDDYGLVGVLSIFLAVSFAFVEGGYRIALIRKLEVTQCELDTAFYTNIALALMLYVLVWICAPSIADFYGQVRLVELFRVAAISLLLQSLSIVHSTVMQRQMMFKLQLATNFPAALLSGMAAVALACFGMGVWAIVAQMVLYPLINSALFWRTGIWRPTLSFSFGDLRSMSRFSILILLSDLQREFFAKMYVATIAKLFVLSVAGLYFFAERVRDLVVQQLVTAVQQVTYPALAKIQDDDNRLLDGYRKIIRLSAFVIYPCFLCLSALSEPLFEFLLPAKWLAAAPYLRIMLLSGLLVPLHRVNGNIIKVKDKPNWMLWLGLFESGSLMLALLLSYSFGVYWILVGHLCATTFVYVVKSCLTRRLLPYAYSMQLADVAPTLLIGALAFGGIAFISSVWQAPAYLKLGGLGLLGMSIYFLLAHLFSVGGYLMLRELIADRLRK
ncbi:MAG: lipopolysaccharide biosynthesis protein [Rhodocyclaceae bacterium]|nr:lipopolysaccharide biosynthesis protein [Rhodocyclaceae bacterium]